MEVFYTDLKTFICDLLSILSGASLLFYFVAPIFLKDNHPDYCDHQQKENDEK
jgi:hypothetical protein